MDARTQRACKDIARDMAELMIAQDKHKKLVYIGMGLALGRVYERETGEDMRIAGPKKIFQWAVDLKAHDDKY